MTTATTLTGKRCSSASSGGDKRRTRSNTVNTAQPATNPPPAGGAVRGFIRRASHIVRRVTEIAFDPNSSGTALADIKEVEEDAVNVYTSDIL